MEGIGLCKFHLKIMSNFRPHHCHTSNNKVHSSLHTHHQHLFTRPTIKMTSILVLLNFFVLCLETASAQQNCTNSLGCFPPIGNLALGRTIHASSTCMENDSFCLFLGSECSVCSPDEEHSARSINDNDNFTFWVSEIDPSSREVSLQLDFEGPVLFQGMAMVWESIRPSAMVLERSCDYGQTWSVYRYYALNCAAAFMMIDTYVGANILPFNGTTPVCTSVQTELFSFGVTDAVMTFSTSEHIPINDEERACYQTITNIRAVMLDFFPEVLISNRNFQYYGVREWIVYGSCMCNGHADTCIPRPGEEMAVDKVYTGCMCQHNTAFPNCDQCSSGFNNAPYQPGTMEESNICEACMCNGHAMECEFDVSQSASVCLNCTDNTTGNQCNECVPGFYQERGLLLNDPNICRECDCHPAGIIDNGVCDGFGQCNCKSNVVSPRCTECEDGYFNLSASNPNGCQLCDCNVFGSQLNAQGLPRCDGIMGTCLCRVTVEGEQCDFCQPGSYDLSSGCPTCDCNFGGAISQICDQESTNGQCPCKPNIIGTLCSIPSPYHYFMALDSFIYEAEQTPMPPEAVLISPVDGRFGSFSGQGFISLPPDASIVFTFSPPQDSQYEIILRFSTVTSSTISASFTLTSLNPVNTSLNCSILSATASNDSLSYITSLSSFQFSVGYYRVDSVCLSRSNLYQLSFSYSSVSASQPLVDSLVLLPDVSVTSAFYASFVNHQPMIDLIKSCLPRSASSNVVNRIECEDLSFTLSTEFLGDDPLQVCDCDAAGTQDINSTCMPFGGGCGPCQPGVTGLRCDSCLNGFFGFSSNGCEACDCDPAGSLSPLCSESGQCPCRPGVGGPTCSDCLPNFFNFTSEGCTPCDCSEFSIASTYCNVTTGQCLCPEGVTGRTCNTCIPEFFNLTSEGCLPCDCNTAGNETGSCDETTGQCLCSGNLVGRQCNQCGDGFFNTSGENREVCTPCVCSGRSSTCSQSLQDSMTSVVHFNFSQLCPTNPTNCSDGWKLLTSEGRDITFGPNDRNGLGYILAINMMPMVFVHDSYLGNRLSSYGFNLTVSVTIVSTAAMNTDAILIKLKSSEANTSLIGYPYIEAFNDGLGDSIFLNFTISFIESNWIYEGSTDCPSLLDFLSFLTNITEISFTADYTVDFIELIYIKEVSLFFSVSSSEPTPPTSSFSFSLPIRHPVENCSCPDAYDGLSCESCARGYARPSGSITDPCVRCECNGQTLDCDVGTTICLNCGGNTTGNNCEHCQVGFYGDPTRGIPCVPCDCPLVENSFSPTCFLNVTDGFSTCDACAEGYIGRNCEECVDGYFGNPMVGRCITCECNGNVDPALGPVCDMVNGRCLNCQNNTEGFECDLCKIGFFGDPGTNQPCRPCSDRCNIYGTDSYCDPLLGTCTCLPNVMGEFCNMCSPGFFNLTSGVGCTECNCDPVGAIGSDCHQDSGNCSCLPNVGSPLDNKCRMCTPGFFNFTEDIGCEACGCSDLAVSDVCDEETGRCDCQEGAVGIKCDDCAFGFSGQVPNCERCHDCYFLWYDIIGNITERANSLQSDINQLITTYYNGHTIESIMDEISMLTERLTLVNETLDFPTLEESDVMYLEMILTEFNATLMRFTERVTEIESDVEPVLAILTTADQFNGTVNMSSIMDLQRELSSLNSTVANLGSLANQSFAQILLDEQTFYNALNGIETANSTAERIMETLREEEARIVFVFDLISSINTAYMMLRNNFTFLDVEADRLTSLLNSVSERADNATADLVSANETLENFSEEVGRRQTEVINLLSLVRTLNDSVQSLEVASYEARSNASDLMETTQQTLNSANDTLYNITDTITYVANITANLSEALAIAEKICSISLPSLEDATKLVNRVMNNIVPDELVLSIMNDVRESTEIADEALQLAQNASDSVNSACNLAAELQNDIACTNATQQQVENSLFILQEIINQTQTDINQVFSLFSELETVFFSVNATYTSITNTIDEASRLGVESQARATNLLYQATAEAIEAEGYRNDFKQTQRELANLSRNVDEVTNGTNALFEDIQNLSDNAQMLEDEATRIALEDIYGLLTEYQVELDLTRDLQRDIDDLTAEMEDLIDTFTAASQRLQQCYRTP